MAPQNSEIKNLVNATNSKVHSLNAAIFHTMAYKMSLEVKNGTLTLPTRRSFLKVLYNVCQFKKKRPNFEQYYRIHVEGPKIAVCETTSETVLVLNSVFTTKDIYFQVVLDAASTLSMPPFMISVTLKNCNDTIRTPTKYILHQNFLFGKTNKDDKN